jgi:hypothetical protein
MNISTAGVDAGFWHRVSHFVSQYFNKSIADSITYYAMYGSMGCSTVAQVVRANAGYDIDSHPDLLRHPTSVEAFLSSTRHVLSGLYQESFRQHASAFDRLAEDSMAPGTFAHHHLSDFFIQQRLSIEWLRMIINNVAAHCDAMAKSTGPLPRTGPGQESHTTTIGTTSTIKESLLEPTETAPSHSSGVTTRPSSVADCPIVQIELRGHSLLPAWKSHPIMREMEDEATYPLRLSHGSPWDPSRHPRLPVYHGTSSHVEHNDDGWLQQFTRRQATVQGTNFNHLMGSPDRMNQVAPNVPLLPVTWTSFSAMRSFLWAMFLGEVIGHVPGPDQTKRLGRVWDCPLGDHKHTGVLLFKFRPQLPASADQSFWIMPRGSEADWNTHRNSLQDTIKDPFLTADQAWDRFSDFHHGSPSTWPNALHCLEFGQQAIMLKAFTTQLWRTVWFGDGIRSLNQSHEATYAITFSLEPKAHEEKDLPSGKLQSVPANHGVGAVPPEKRSHTRGLRAWFRRVLTRLHSRRH